MRHRGVVTADEAEFIALWIKERSAAKARIALHLGTGYNLIASFTDHLYLLPANQWKFLAFHGASLAVVALYWLVLRRFRFPLELVIYPLQLATVAFFSLMLRHSFDVGGLEPLFNGAALLGIATLLLPICPFNNAMVPLTAVLFIGFQMAAWGGFTAGGIRWFAIAAFAMASALFFHYYTLYQIRREAGLEYEARRKILSEARLKMEHELDLARDIQESLAPPPERLLADNLKVHCYQLKNAQVGGDWMAVQQLRDGSMVAVVADATGKGISAALVVHAVQSLWADEMSYEQFDPLKWTQRVNRTLMRLGEKKPHSLTLGIVVLAPDAVTYYSAGHIPAFVVVGDGENAEVRALAARGPMLGISPDIKLQPVVMDLKIGESASVILATDGVIEKGTRASARDVLALRDRLRADSKDALLALPGEDDKTVVWLQRRAG